MKNTYLTLIALFAALQFSYAQTNTFPSSGNVGIGTTAPSNNLQIGTTSQTSTASPATLSLGGTYSSSHGINPKMKIFDDGSSFWGIGASSGQLDYIVTTSYDHVFYAGSNELMKIKGNGNVGIGTATPQRKLDLSNNGQLTFGDDVVTSSNNGIFWFSGDHYGIYRTSGPWTSNTFQQLRLQFDTGIQLAPGPDVNTGYDKSFVEVVTGKGLMVSSGNVGIGTTDTKGYKLAVNGAAIATSMKVKLYANWPDFVFKKDYKLPTLTEVKTYIDKNQHLPDMPSADEVHKNGLDLGEMNRLLLKKVEELTLYLIEKEKQLSEQQAENKLQNQRISALEKAQN